MTANTNRHPGAQDLADFDAGRLPAARAAAVEAHVAGCASCCQRLEELPEDALSALLRAYVGRGESAARGVPEALVGHPRYRVLGLLGRGGTGAV
jgi:anti-sigma factor RsiW